MESVWENVPSFYNFTSNLSFFFIFSITTSSLPNIGPRTTYSNFYEQIISTRFHRYFLLLSEQRKIILILLVIYHRISRILPLLFLIAIRYINKFSQFLTWLGTSFKTFTDSTGSLLIITKLYYYRGNFGNLM